MEMRGIAGDERTDIMVGHSRIRCRVIREHRWFDTVTIEKGTSQVEFFYTLTCKTRGEANFEGDKALIKEREYAQIWAMQALVEPEYKRVLSAFERGSYRMLHCDCLVHEGSNDQICGKKAEHYWWHLAKGILVMGGRTIAFKVELPELAKEKMRVTIGLRGLHLIPVGVVRREHRKPTPLRVQRPAPLPPAVEPIYGKLSKLEVILLRFIRVLLRLFRRACLASLWVAGMPLMVVVFSVEGVLRGLLTFRKFWLGILRKKWK